MAGLCKQFDVKTIDDIIALIALYRPGPMDLIADYIKRKKGLTKIKYEHPLLAEVCADTYGVMIYQEQVMAAARCCAGIRSAPRICFGGRWEKRTRKKWPGSARSLSRAVRRRTRSTRKEANSIFDLLEKFAGYGFSKSHSVAYGLISLSDRVLTKAKLAGRVHGRGAAQTKFVAQHRQNFPLSSK